MDSLTGKHSRKRQSNDDKEHEKHLKLTRIEGPKEIIPSIFKSLTLTKRKISSEHISKPEELAELKNIPCDTEAALLNLRALFPVKIFEGRLPPVLLYSQLSSLIHSRAVIDHQLRKLSSENKILTFSLFSSTNYLIVFYSDFQGITRNGLFQRFVDEVLGDYDASKTQNIIGSSSSSSGISESSKPALKRSIENSTLVSKESLVKRWKFEEDEVRQLVNSGYLGVQEGGYYCISLPSAGEFTKVYHKGKKTVMNSIKRAKFGEILETELEKRPMKKTAPLGVSYHIHDLIGSGEAIKLDTTSGPLLRIKRDIPM